MDDFTQYLQKISADPTVRALIPVAGMLLAIAVPEVPAVIWVAIITALLSGDLTPEHIQSFMDEHNIKTFAEYPTEVKS